MPADIAPSPITATTLCVSPVEVAGDRHAERRRRSRSRNAPRRTGRTRSRRAGEAGKPAALAQRADAVAAPGQDLVRVGLVADVPDQPVARRVEDVVQRDRQLDHAEPGAEMAAGHRNRVDRLARAARRRPAAAASRPAGAGPRACGSCREAVSGQARESFSSLTCERRYAPSLPQHIGRGVARVKERRCSETGDGPDPPRQPLQAPMHAPRRARSALLLHYAGRRKVRLRTEEALFKDTNSIAGVLEVF